MWLHPAFEPAAARFAHSADKLTSDVDVVTKGILPKGFAITLFFDDDAPQSSKEPAELASPVATSTRRGSGDSAAGRTAEPAETAVV